MKREKIILLKLDIRLLYSNIQNFKIFENALKKKIRKRINYSCKTINNKIIILL